MINFIGYTWLYPDTFVEQSAAINGTQVLSFLEGLCTGLPDLRDNRGKRHSQEFTLVAVAIAMMAQCRTLSSIHRFIGLRTR